MYRIKVYRGVIKLISLYQYIYCSLSCQHMHWYTVILSYPYERFTGIFLIQYMFLTVYTSTPVFLYTAETLLQTVLFKDIAMLFTRRLFTRRLFTRRLFARRLFSVHRFPFHVHVHCCQCSVLIRLYSNGQT